MSPRARTVAATVVVAALLLMLPAVPLLARDSAKGRWLKVRVYDDGATTPTVLVNVPMGVVTAFLKIAAKADVKATIDGSTSERPSGHARLRDIDLEELVQELEAMDPGQIFEVQEDGHKVEIWIE